MEQKAFVFDQPGFTTELSSTLRGALETGELGGLTNFIDENLASLKDPYEGNPLDSSWQDLIETHDAHQLGDFALTKYYDPLADIGLGPSWEEVAELLNAQGINGDAVVLGSPFGPRDHYFDPGKMGSYFQSPELVRQNLNRLRSLIAQKPALAPQLAETLAMLEQAEKAGQGLYVTF